MPPRMFEAAPVPLRDEPLESETHSALGRAVENLTRLQDGDGSWPGDYGGPMFLLPMYVALCHASGRLPEPAVSDDMRRYMLSVEHEDGGIGLHAEDPRGCQFTTTLCYVALRILGCAADDEALVRMRTWIHAHGTPLGAAAWGKLTLCLLGLYDWRGIHPILPELWLLPRRTPFHPGRLWCHCRQVYLPMAWLYGKRATIPENDLIRSLRDELYAGRWQEIDWEAQRDTLSETDTYRATTRTLRAANAALGRAERSMPQGLRKRALDAVFEHILYEDRVTDFIDIGPVNKVLNAFVHYFSDAKGEPFERAFARTADYLWQGHDGTKMQGYNNSRLWDTAFAVQAVLAAQLPEESEPLLARAYDYLRDNQILEDVPNREQYFRHASRGGWPFSNRAHGWPITDCTAEGFKCALALEGRYADSIPEGLLRESVALILSFQNEDGGFATYERQRGGAWLELLNPSQVFGDIMVDYSHVECTSACLQALARARDRFGGDPAIERALDRGAAFLRQRQRPDGSFEGAWAVCFTYGTWFGVTGLLASGAKTRDPDVLRACAFLLQKQRPDGSWGEHGDSCRERRYIDAEGTVVQTAWALLALVRARHADKAAQARAARFLLERQASDGSWPREPLVGVFNRTCLINYDNYRHYFPLWALAEWVTSARAEAAI